MPQAAPGTAACASCQAHVKRSAAGRLVDWAVATSPEPLAATCPGAETKEPHCGQGSFFESVVLGLEDLHGHNVDCAGAFRALFDVEGYALSFSQRFETTDLDGAAVNEGVFGPVGRCDETEAFLVVEPFNCSGSHICYL